MLRIYDPFRHWIPPDMENKPGRRFGETGTYIPGAKPVEMHPIDARVHREVSKGVRYGIILRGPCVCCGEPQKAVAHHESYVMACMIIWLCRLCHTFRHIRWRYEADHASQTPRIIGEILYEAMPNNPTGVITLDDTVDVCRVRVKRRK